MFPFPTPCKGKSKSQPFAHTFALTGRRRLCIDTQGVALGWGLVGLSARAGPQTRLFPHNLHQLDISILNTLAASGIARTFGGGLRRSTVAHFARKVRGDEYCGGQTRAKNPTKSCTKALTIFATCSWPSLCEQSELQCWRRNRRLCGPAQISAARTLLLIFNILS